MADRNKTKNVRIWDGYGVGFWQMMTGVIFQFLVSIGLFFGTGWLMNHKVNIK